MVLNCSVGKLMSFIHYLYSGKMTDKNWSYLIWRQPVAKNVWVISRWFKIFVLFARMFAQQQHQGNSCDTFAVLGLYNKISQFVIWLFDLSDNFT